MVIWKFWHQYLDIGISIQKLAFPVSRMKMVMIFIVWNCSFFMGIIFCSSVALVWTFNTGGVHNFITFYHQRSNCSNKFSSFVLQWCLVPILFLPNVWSNNWFEKYFILWKNKKARVICSKQGKILLLIKR